ncbi:MULTISPECIES: aspartate kinase [Streptomyces]|uniref:aspartate kinase n=1 Tax=Streptomyces ramulosus TaxID=47762 RepID=A0ABW1FHC1_9ACTN
MALIVQKYGGTSVGSPERIRRVAARVVAAHAAGHDVVVVVSAMGATTEELLQLAGEVSPDPVPRELDLVLTAGEQIANALTAMAVTALGVPARSFTGPQAGVLTTTVHGDARIVAVEPRRIRLALDRGEIPFVAGFQGRCRETGEVTTLGRGGSDTTAIALAAALKADVCEICTDVDGVYTADPRTDPSARLLRHVTYAAMRRLAADGAEVLALRSVDHAARYGVTVHVRSSFHDRSGTVMSASPVPAAPSPAGRTVARTVVGRSYAGPAGGGAEPLPGAAAGNGGGPAPAARPLAPAHTSGGRKAPG